MENNIAGTDKVKMRLNFSHDVLMSILFTGLGFPLKTVPYFADNLILELWEEDNEHYVRALRNGKPFKIGYCVSEFCAYDEFKRFMKSAVASGTVEEACK